MIDCLFCKIAHGEIPCEKVYENDRVFAFKDINPVAPFHVLIVPKVHIESVTDINIDNSYVIANIFEVAAIIVKQNGYEESGYRIVTNIGKDGGQAVSHLHYHLLAGRAFSWPPG